VQIALPLGCCPQKPAALGRAQPFVTVADIPIGADRVEIDRCLSGGMGSVDQYSYPAEWHRARISAIGKTNPLGEVMWSMTAIHVRGVNAALTAATIAAGWGRGNGIAASNPCTGPLGNIADRVAHRRVAMREHHYLVASGQR
jgi:hypothetical protein